MKFNEFDLYNAIHDVYVDFEKNNLKPRSADWLIYLDKRFQLRRLITAKLESSRSEEEILKAWDDFGKNKQKYKLLVAVANKYGHSCFYRDRTEGRCSSIMSIERLPSAIANRLNIQQDNCVIVCKRHNHDKAFAHDVNGCV